jgi:hypothetical protein
VGFPPNDQNMSFVDTFGAERSRTWSPSLESGDFYLRLTQSCLRVLALAYSSGASSCDVAGELCCDRRYDRWTPVWSLQADGEGPNGAFLVTADEAEKNSLLQGGGWQELCASSFGNYGTDTFCYTMAMRSFAAHQGPFLLHALPTAPPAGAASLLFTEAGRSALYRCRSSGGRNRFLSADSSGQCGGKGTQESLLGYSSAVPHTGMPRRLWGCATPGDVSYHVLDADCVPGDQPMALGWVM